MELLLFADRYTTYRIFTDSEKFEVYKKIWPRSDIKDFVETHDEDRMYNSLIQFLLAKGSKLLCILVAIPSWPEPVNFQNLFLSAKQWENAKEEDRVEYFVHKHALNILKNKIKECFGFNMTSFLGVQS